MSGPLLKRLTAPHVFITVALMVTGMTLGFENTEVLSEIEANSSLGGEARHKRRRLLQKFAQVNG